MDKTLGVLSANKEIRNAHIQRNIAKYAMYDAPLSPALGDYYEIYTRPLASLTNGDSLFDYTHGLKNRYSEEISERYLSGNIEGHSVYTSDGPVFKNYWNGDYNNYLDYVMAVYGHEHAPIRFIEGLLSLSFMDEAIRLSAPAVIRDIAPTLSIAGVVKTNHNNFSGTDTRLGLITNQMYARSLYDGAVYNSDRQATSSYVKSVITPSMVYKYGNTLNNINNLPNLFAPNHSEGKIIDDYSQDVEIFDSVKEIIDLNTVNLYDVLKNNKSQDFIGWNGSAYIKSGTTDYYGDDTGEYVKHSSTTLYTNRGKVVNAIGEDISEFRNSDTRAPGNAIKEFYDGKISHIVYEDEGHSIEMPFDDTQFDKFRSVDDKIVSGTDDSTLADKSLLSKTNQIFKEHKIHTIYGEHRVRNGLGMGKFGDKSDKKTTTTDTAKSGYGKSRGRNLLKKNPSDPNGKVNGYDNPYCRVWTYHHQYDRVNRMVRPFTDPKSGKVMDLREVQDLNDNYRSFIYTGKDKDGRPTGLKGSDYLADNTVLRKTGFVNITPSLSDKTDIKKCMFSIENLAWKDVPENREDILSKEQRGPNGGRIMWFPPYDINFQENVNAQWEGNTFIGRGEKVYTYSNTDRNGTLSFTLLIDHPAILNDLHNESGNENPSYYNSDTTEDRSKDMEGDILRFFAGCMPLKYRKKRDDITLENEPQLEKQKTKEERIKIYVFFPNDYSGHMTSKPKNSGEDRQVKCDTDFIEYMLCGKNAGIPKDNNGNGYEMLRDNSRGISEGEGYKLKDDEIIRACKDYSVSYRECNKDYEGITGRTRKDDNGNVIKISKEQDKNERIFQYRVDYDLRQNGLYVGNNISNYKDTASFGLNSSIDVVTDIQQGNKQSATYTFAEFCCALMELKGEDKYDLNLYNKSLGYVETAIGAERAKERINNLCSILSKDRQFTTIKINGGATKQDPSRSDMLGNRRCGTLKSLFLDAYSFRANSTKEEEKINIIINETPEVNELKYDKKLISTIDPKRERFAVIDIGYIVSEEKKVSDKNEPALSNKHKDLVYKLYQLMLERSGILREYNNITPLWDEFFKWFESDTKNTKKIKEDFTDKRLEDIFNKENPFDEVKYIDSFFLAILSFSNEIYKNSNVIISDISGNTDSTGSTFSGYSRTLELSNSTSNDDHNEAFENVLAKVNKMEDIEHFGDVIEETKKNIAEIQEEYDKQSDKISEIEKKMISISNELAEIDPTNISKYEEKLEELKKVTQQISGETENLMDIKEKLDEENVRLSFNISKRISAIGLKTRGFKKKLDALKLARKTYVNNGKGLLDLEEKLYKKLIGEIDELEKELIEITEETNPKSTRINSVILQIKTKKNKLKTTNKLIASYQEKVDKIDNKIKDIWEQYKDQINKIKIASYGNMTYAIRSIISNSDANLYDSLKLTETEIDSMTGYTYSDYSVEDMFVNPLFYYNTITTGLISAFDKGKEEPYKDNVYYKFWPIYAIYLLVRWIEDDICEEMDSGVNDGSKQTDELNELFKYTIDSLFENKNMDTAIEIMTLLVAKKRISEVNKEKFNIDGVSCTTLIDTTKLQELSGVTKFIEYSGSTTGSDMLELSIEAVKEIDERLSVLSKDLKSKAEKMRDDANNNDNGNTNISENNGSNKADEVNDDSANTVYKREALRTKNYRYETESEYFSKLKENDPIIWKNIKDKIKYFDPAFHSMSPEGFNARLTFLQQCTRQGHTLEQRNSSDNYTQTANNLAFGRMPVCILRLGDFIYSRIIINTMSISYGDGGIQWDLNPEGAGVQPMMAKISMGITILGGQSLEGPVSRLQNAVTFNYYANAGVYDDRADRAKPAYGYDAIEWTENGENKKGNKRIFYDTVEAAESNIRNGEIKVKNAEGPVHMTNHYHVWTPFQKDN